MSESLCILKSAPNTRYVIQRTIGYLMCDIGRGMTCRVFTPVSIVSTLVSDKRHPGLKKLFYRRLRAFRGSYTLSDIMGVEIKCSSRYKNGEQ